MELKPIVLEEIKEYARKNELNKVILFGSRARGDQKKKSDIDLTVTGGNVTAFAIDVDEKTSTLLKFDIVNLDASVQDELRKSIDTEGIIIYEKI